MATNQKVIYVYDSFSSNTDVLLGTFYVDVIRGGESYSFEYDSDWLKKTAYSVSLDPALCAYNGRQYSLGRNMFGVFADASPDRWGRILMNKRERFTADKELRKPRKLYDSDYLLGVYDETRMGGLRFKLDKDGPFLSDDKDDAVPPWATLRTLEEASRNYENDETGLDERWLNQLIRPGSSLGGADPVYSREAV